MTILRAILKGLLPILILSLNISLTACSTRPDGLMAPTIVTEPPANAEKVNLLVYTNREREVADDGVMFSGRRSDTNSLQEVVVSIPPDANRKVGHIQWPKSQTPDLSKEFAVLETKDLTIPESREWAKAHFPNNNGSLLIFVHGYNTPYDGGIFLLAQIINDSGVEAAPVLFSWPSLGSLLGYNYDRESATISRSALAELLSSVNNDVNIKDVTILAHSMGGWLTMEALRTLALKDGKLPDKIQNVILASPDIDINVFAKQYKELGAVRPPLTLIISRNDRALKVSRMIGGNIDRLGALNLDKDVYRNTIKLDGVNVIDLSHVRVGDPSGHLKFSESPAIVQLIGKGLINGQALSEDNGDIYDKVGVYIQGSTGSIIHEADKTKRKINRGFSRQHWFKKVLP